MRLDIGIVLQPQCHRIHAQRVRKLIERRFDTERACRFSGRALECRDADMHRGQTMARRDIGTGVQRARRRCGAFHVILHFGGMRNHIVTNGGHLTIPTRCHDDVLLGLGPAANRSKHLRAREHHFDGPPHMLRSHGSQNDMRPCRAFAAESAPDIGIDHTHVLRCDAQRLRHRVTHAGDILGSVVQRELVAVPLSHGRMGLHRIVVLHWRGIHGIDADFAIVETRFEVAPGFVGGHDAFLLGTVNLTLRLSELQHRGLDGV